VIALVSSIVLVVLAALCLVAIFLIGAIAVALRLDGWGELRERQRQALAQRRIVLPRAVWRRPIWKRC
jgi:hypothetical protein